MRRREGVKRMEAVDKEKLLVQQLLLLSEKSKEAKAEDLVALTHAMCEVYKTTLGL